MNAIKAPSAWLARATGNIKPVTVKDIQRISSELDDLYSFGESPKRFADHKSRQLAAMEA